MIDNTWYPDGYFWRKVNDDGSDGMGDLEFNSDDYDIRKWNTSNWAQDAVKERMNLLQDCKRWPDRMNDHPSVVNTWIGRVIGRSRNWLRHKFYKLSGKYIGKRQPFRYQKRMTRDPYTSWATNAIRLYKQDLIKEVKLPWYIYRPSFWAWWNYLKTKDEKYLRRYRFWRKTWFKSDKPFVIRLNEIREIGIDLILKYE